MAVVLRPKITVTADTETLVQQLEVIATVSSGAESFYSTDQVTWIKFENSLLLTENGVYYFKAVDPSNGLESSSYTELEVNNIDSEAPYLEITSDIQSLTNKDITLTATTDGGTIEHFENGEWVSGSTMLVTQNGTYRFRVTDEAGNVTGKSFTVHNIDKTPPTLEITGNPTEWTNREYVTLTATVYDDRGLRTVEYFDGTQWVAGSSLTVTQNGTYTFRVTDEAGNITEKSVVVDKIDQTPPELKITGTFTGNDIKLAATAGEDTVEYFNGTEWVSCNELLISDAGTYTFRATDAAGNVTEKQVLVVKGKADSISPADVLFILPDGIVTGGTIRGEAFIYEGAQTISLRGYQGAKINGFLLEQSMTLSSDFSNPTAQQYLLRITRASVNNGDTGNVYAGQEAINATIQSGGKLVVHKNGLASSIQVMSGGSITLLSGSALQNTISNDFIQAGASAIIQAGVSIRGTIRFNAGTMVNGFLLNESTELSNRNWNISAATVKAGETGKVFAGQTFSNVQVEEGGKIEVLKGGTAKGISVAAGASVIIEPGAFIESMTVAAGATVNGFTVNKDVTIIDNTLDITGLTVKAGGTGKIFAGQTVSDIQVEEGGKIEVLKGGTAKSISVAAGASVIIEQGALFESLTFSAGATVNGFTVDKDVTFIDNTLDITGLTVKAGETGKIFAGQKYAGIRLEEGGHLIVSAGGLVNGLTCVPRNSYDPATNPIRFSITLEAGAVLTGDIPILAGTSLTIPEGVLFGTLRLLPGAIVNGIRVSGQLDLYNSVVEIPADAVVPAGETGTVYAGQKYDYIRVQRDARIEVLSGGTVKNLSINGVGVSAIIANDVSFESLSLASGTKVNGITLNSSLTLTDNNFYISDATIKAGETGKVFAGQTVSGIKVCEGGHLVVSAGGQANGLSLSPGSSLTLEDGAVLTGSITVPQGASVTIHEGASFESLTVAVGATINGLTVRMNAVTFTDGILNMSDTTVKSETTVKAGDKGQVGKNQTVTDILLSEGGQLTIHDGSETQSIKASAGSSITVNAGAEFGSLTLVSGSEVNGFSVKSQNICSDNVLSVSGAIVFSGKTGTIYNGQSMSGIFVAGGGELIVHTGGTANAVNLLSGASITVHSGAFFDLIQTNTIAKVNGFTVTGSLYENVVDIQNAFVNVNDTATVYDGQRVYSADVYTGGHLIVHTGGTAERITISSGASVTVYNDAHLNSLSVRNAAKINGFTLQNSQTFSGDNLMISNATVNAGDTGALYEGQSVYSVYVDGDLVVHSGGIVEKATVDGNLTALSGSIINDVTVGGTITIQDNASFQYLQIATPEAKFNGFSFNQSVLFRNNIFGSAIVNAGDTGTVYAGQTARTATVEAGGNMIVRNGGTVNGVTIRGGSLLLQGTLDCTASGGISVQAGSSTIKVDGGKIALSLTRGLPPLNCSLIEGIADDTISISVDNCGPGEYTIASRYTGSFDTITVVNEEITLGQITVDGSDVRNDMYSYSLLTDTSGQLNIVIKDIAPPEAPVISSVSTTNPTNQDVIITLSVAADAVSNEYSFDGKNWYSFENTVTADKNGIYYFRSTDEAGNVSDITTYEISNINKVLPTLEITGNASDWTKLDVTLTATASEGTVEYFNGTEWVAGTVLTVSENGTYKFRVTDEAGNVASQDVVVDKIDKTAPTAPQISVSNNGRNVTVSHNGVTETGSGVGRYIIEISTTSDFSTLYETYSYISGDSYSKISLEDGNYYFRMKAEDALGNVGKYSNVANLTIDTTAPDAPAACADITDPTNKKITVTAKFSEDSVIKEFSRDGSKWSAYTTGVVFEDNGVVYFRAVDAAGNVSDITTYTVSNIDRVPPTLEITGNASDWTPSDVTLTATANEGTVEYFNGTEWVAGTVLTVSENGTYKFRVTDEAGNVASQDVVVDKIDKIIVPQNPQGTADSLSWQGTRYADSYQVDLSTGGSDNTLSFNTSGTGVDIYSSAENTFNWQVSADGGESVPGNDIMTNAADPQKHSSVENGLMDLFIAGSSGIWENDYVAMHLGIASGRAGTNEFVELSGKNILADFFEGSEDANILIMTDDANGDALFVDDIYTALPGMVSEPQSRIARIDEIRAGNGDDIVDMTSQIFTYSGNGVKIYGGLGNDTIWANIGQNTLFGDAGEDRLVGGSDDDVLIGGSGSDSMHGGGGNDIFCFGGDWGQDTVEQFDGGSVTLWFENGSENNWDASTLTYTDGGKSVTVSGVSTVTLKFGDVDSAVAGAFLDAASENIFEDKDRGMLA